MRLVKEILILLGVLWLYEHLSHYSLDQTVNLAIAELKQLIQLTIQFIQHHQPPPQMS